MKLKIALLLIGLVLGSISHAQIKIGTNPQNINASSVLELESTSRALVLTRVNSTQMNAIRPLQGALVYNTETKCVHYYDGTQWLNICDALTNSVNISMVDNGDGSYTFTDAVGVETIITTTTNATFEVANDSLVLTDSNNNALSVALDSLNRHTYSTDAIVNLLPINDSTIVIRRTGNNYNFEVGEITGSNIQDRSIRNVDIGPTAINGDFHIQNRSVTPIKIQPGTLGQILQTQTISGVLTPAWVNKAGLFNATEISYDASVSGLAAANVKDAIDELSTTSNSLNIGDILTQGNDAGAQLIRNVLDPSDAQDVATRNYVDNAISGSNILADANIFVGDATGTAQAVPVSGDATIDNTGILTIAPNAITFNEILDRTIGEPDLSFNAVTNDIIRVDAVTTDKILNETILSEDIADDAIDNSKIADNAVQVENILNGTANQVLKTNAAGTLVEWGTLSSNNITGQDLTADDTSITVTGGTGTTLVTTGLAVSNLGITNAKLAADAVDNTKIEDNAVQTENILDGEVTTADIANDAIDNSKIADSAVQVENILNGTANQVLKTNAAGTLVEWGTLNSNNITGQDLTADDTSITVTGGTGTTLATTGLAVSNLGITNEKLAPDAVDNAKIADDAIQTENILDGEVTNPDIANDAIDNSKIADNAVQTENILNGTADQVLKTNAAGTAVEWGALDANNITGQDLTAGDASITVTGGLGTTLANTGITVSDLGITNAKLAPDAVDNSKIADNAVQTENILNGTADQVLKTNGAGTLVEWGTLNSDNIVGQDLTPDDASIMIIGGAGTTLNTTQLAVSNLGITNGKLAPDAVDNAKIADDAIQTENILDGEVTNPDIANDAIDNSKIADNAVQVENISNGTADQVLKTNAAGTAVEWGALDANNITGQDLSAGDASITVTGGLGTTLANTGITVSDLGITNAKLAPDAVDNSKIADNAIQTENILNGNVTPQKIVAGADNEILVSNGGIVSWTAPAVIAMGKIDALATGSQRTKGASATQTNTGNYTVTLANPRSTADYVIQLTLLNAGSDISIEVISQTINSFTVQISQLSIDTTGPSPILTSTPVDDDWYFTVTDF